MTCPVCESTDTAECEAREDEGSWQCRNPDCQAKFDPTIKPSEPE